MFLTNINEQQNCSLQLNWRNWKHWIPLKNKTKWKIGHTNLNMATQSGMPLYWRWGWAMILSTARGLVTRPSTHSRLRRALRVTSLWHPSDERPNTVLRTASWNSCPLSFNAVNIHTVKISRHSIHFFLLTPFSLWSLWIKIAVPIFQYRKFCQQCRMFAKFIFSIKIF